MINLHLKLKKKIFLIIFFIITILILTYTFFSKKNEGTDKKINESSVNKNFNQEQDIEKSEEKNKKKETKKSFSDESKSIKEKERTLPKNQSKLNNLDKKIKEKNPSSHSEDSKSKNLDAIDTINELHEGLIKVSNKEIYEYKKFMPIIKNTYDIEKMLIMILGNSWKNSNLEKQKKILSAFEEYVTKNYLKRFIKIRNAKFKIEKKKNIKNKFIMVETILIPNNNETVSINYLLSNKNGEWKIFDVLLAGSISEIATKKSEFSSLLKDGKIDKLIEALNEKNSILLN